MDTQLTPGPRKRPISINTSRNTEIEGRENSKENEVAIEEPVSPAGRLFHQPEFNCYIISVVGVGKLLDIELMKSGLKNTLIRHPRFSSIVVKDDGKKPRWIPATVVINDHVIIPDIDPPTSTALADKVVEDYIAAFSTTPMDYSRPLWELHLLNFPTTMATATGIFRLHHSLGDGISLVSLLLACTRKTSDPKSLPTLPQPPKPTPENKSSFTILKLSLWLWKVIVLCWNTAVDVSVFVATALFLSDSPNPLKGSKGFEHRPKRFVHRNLGLDDIKEVKNALHCTVNDVLLGITSAALSAYLGRKYVQNEDGSSKDKQLPKNLRVRSTVLVNVRPAPGIHALSELMEGKSKGKGVKWGNLIGYLILPITITKCKDPLEYIHMGKALGDRKKNSLEAIFTYWSGDLILKLFGVKAATFLCSRVLLNTTFSFSNILGPIEEIEFFGHPLVYLAPTVYGHPQALTLHYQSYLNKMTISLAVDELTIPDPHQLLGDFAESLKLMKEAIAAKS